MKAAYGAEGRGFTLIAETEQDKEFLSSLEELKTFIVFGTSTQHGKVVRVKLVEPPSP